MNDVTTTAAERKFDLEHPRDASQNQELKGALYLHYRNYVATIARRHLHSLITPGYWAAIDADDLAQEIWANILLYLNKYDPDRAPFKAWICASARHTLLKIRYKSRRRAGLRKFLPECDHSASETNINAMIDTSMPDPMGCAEANDFWQFVCLGADATQRMVIVLRHRHGLEQAQIGHIVGLSPMSISARLIRFNRLVQKNFAHFANR